MLKGKNIIIFAAIFLSFFVAYSQKVTIADEKFNEHKQAGDRYYQDEEYYLAAQEYLKASKLKPNDPYVDYQLAECYRKNLDYDDAEIWYEKVLNLHSTKFPYAQFWLGLMQKTNGKYIEAEVSIQKFINTFKPKTEEDKIRFKEAEFEYRGCVYALEELKKPQKEIDFKLLPPPVNSKNTDFAPMIFYHDSSIVITSMRADSKGSEMNMATGEARSDNFRYEKVGEKWERTHNNDGFDIVNTKYDDGAGELTKDKHKYYYTICDPECAIYVSKKVNEKFTKPLKLNKNINPINTWNAQPTLSPTADTMFFVSKRPGGKGMNDVWMSINKDKTGQAEDWQPAMNMVKINTPYVEISPFWDDHTNTIYFASNGHEGFGGLDIYLATGRKRDSIVNLGLPFNSNRDDFYFNIGKDKGYLVSNRKGGIGLLDIYEFDLKAKESIVGEIPKENFVDAQSITSIGTMVYNDTQQPVANVSVALKDEKGEIIKEAKTNSNGEFRFDNLPTDQNFKITMAASDPRIEAKVNYLVEKKKVAVAAAPAETKPAETAPAKTEKPKVTAETANTVLTPEGAKENPASAEKQKTSGDDNTLAFNTAPAVSKPNNTPKQSAVSGSKSNVTVSSFQVKPSPKKSMGAVFENVYFDFNSIELTNAGKKIMDELLNYYGENKGIQIEIRAYTDGYGDPVYNKHLAEMRAQACYDYLVGRGVDQTALVTIPVGAGKPVGSNNSYIGRQLNRRVEFSILGAKDKYEPMAMAYVIEPHMTLWSISKKFAMTVDELKSLNGISETDIKAYSTIRVKRGANTQNIDPFTIANLQEGIQEYKFKDMKFIPVGGTVSTASATENTAADASSEPVQNNEYPDVIDGYYTVQPKETLYAISKKLGMTVEKLKSLNGLMDNNLYTGQQLKVK